MKQKWLDSPYKHDTHVLFEIVNIEFQVNILSRRGVPPEKTQVLEEHWEVVYWF